MNQGHQVYRPDKTGNIQAIPGSPIPMVVMQPRPDKHPNEGTIDRVLVVPLHGGVDPDFQKAAFIPFSRTIRKIVFSTLVAETSVTIDGLTYVIDSGLTKEARYDPIKKVTAPVP